MSNPATRTPGSLVDRQQKAADAILALGQNGPRSSGYKLTLLNKKSRGLAAIRRKFGADSLEAGFTYEQIRQQWQDVKDIAELQFNAE